MRGQLPFPFYKQFLMNFFTCSPSFSLVPRPVPFLVAQTQLLLYFLTCMTSMVERWLKGLNWTWVHWGSEQRELRYQVSYHTYVASWGSLLHTPSIELVVGWTIRETFCVFVLNILAICRLRHVHVRKDTRVSLLFRTASDKKLGGAWQQDWWTCMVCS